MKRIGDKAARVLLTIFGVKTTIIIGTVLTLAIILVTIIAGIMGTVSSSGDKSKKISSQCVTYQKDGDEEDDDGSKSQSTSTKTDSASAGDSDPFTKGTKAYENAHKVFMVVVSMTPFLRELCQRQVVHLTHLVVVESSSLTPTQNMHL